MPSSGCARWNRLGRERRGRDDRTSSPGSEADSQRSFVQLAVDAA